MDIYSFSLALGAAGLGVMGLSGLAHTLGGHHGDSAPASTHTGHQSLAMRGGHARAGASHGHAHAGGLRAGASRFIWSLLSPRPLFSVLLGFGATGMALRGVTSGVLLSVLAAAGGLVLELGVMSPLWNFLFQFESAPALTLESCIGDEARAATNFDADGHGLIAIELDGQLVQVLGSLPAADRQAGVRVRAGDTVLIDDVDAERNRCTVRPLGS